MTAEQELDWRKRKNLDLHSTPTIYMELSWQQLVAAPVAF